MAKKDLKMYDGKPIIEASDSKTLKKKIQAMEERPAAPYVVQCSKRSTSIKEWAFKEDESIAVVIIPEGVTEIGDYAFRYCKSLTNVIFPDTLTTIGEGAFSGCSSLKEVRIPKSVERIMALAFDECPALDAISVAEDNTVYDSREGCNAIIRTAANKLIKGCKNTVIPSTVTVMNHSAFKWCEGLTEIVIPDSVVEIGANAFAGCTDLAEVHLPKSLQLIDGYLFCDCQSLTKIDIPNSVKTIDHNAFCGCSALASVTIPDSVTTIGESAFRGCKGLTSVTIPDSVTSIGQCAFEHCESLTKIVLPPSIKGIEINTFQRCFSLTDIVIPESVTYIKSSAFSGCRNLAAVVIPDSVATIGMDAFGYCGKLTEITIPASVTEIHKFPLTACVSLKSIVVAEGNPVYDSREGCNAIIETKTNRLIQGCVTTVIPDTVVEIAEDSFRELPDLKEIVIPRSVTHIGANAFINTGISKVEVYNPEIEIGRNSFPDGTEITLKQKKTAGALLKNTKTKKMKYLNYFFDSDWYEELMALVEEADDCPDTTKFDEDVYSVLRNSDHWDLEADEIDYDKPGIWVDENNFPYNFTVINKDGIVVLEYC